MMGYPESGQVGVQALTPEGCRLMVTRGEREIRDHSLAGHRKDMSSKLPMLGETTAALQ
jgi:hypothetical protein